MIFLLPGASAPALTELQTHSVVLHTIFRTESIQEVSIELQTF